MDSSGGRHMQQSCDAVGLTPTHSINFLKVENETHRTSVRILDEVYKR